MATYAIATYGIEIQSGGDIDIKERSTGNTVDTYDLNEKNFVFSKTGSNFSVVGKEEILPGYSKFSDTSASGNSVELTTSAELDNIGSGGPWDLANGDCEIVLSGSNLEFYKGK